MKKRLQGFILGFLVATLCLGFSSMALADGGFWKTINAEVGKVIVNTSNFSTKDTLLYNGTTYIPLRGVLESVECQVNWYEDTNSVSVINLASKSKQLPAINNNTSDTDNSETDNIDKGNIDVNNDDISHENINNDNTTSDNQQDISRTDNVEAYNKAATDLYNKYHSAITDLEIRRDKEAADTLASLSSGAGGINSYAQTKVQEIKDRYNRQIKALQNEYEANLQILKDHYGIE